MKPVSLVMAMVLPLAVVGCSGASNDPASNTTEDLGARGAARAGDAGRAPPGRGGDDADGGDNDRDDDGGARAVGRDGSLPHPDGGRRIHLRHRGGRHGDGGLPHFDGGFPHFDGGMRPPGVGPGAGQHADEADVEDTVVDEGDDQVTE